MAKEPSSPRVDSPRLLEPTKEIDEPAQVEVVVEEPTQVEVIVEELSVEPEEPVQEYLTPFVFLLFCCI